MQCWENLIFTVMKLQGPLPGSLHFLAKQKGHSPSFIFISKSALFAHLAQGWLNRAVRIGCVSAEFVRLLIAIKPGTRVLDSCWGHFAEKYKLRSCLQHRIPEGCVLSMVLRPFSDPTSNNDKYNWEKGRVFVLCGESEMTLKVGHCSFPRLSSDQWVLQRNPGIRIWLGPCFCRLLN